MLLPVCGPQKQEERYSDELVPLLRELLDMKCYSQVLAGFVDLRPKHLYIQKNAFACKITCKRYDTPFQNDILNVV